MYIIRRKSNWKKVLVLIIFVAVAGGWFLFSRYNSLAEKLAVLAAPVVREPVPLPTEIDQNFLTQVDKCFIPTAAIYGYALRVTSGFRSMDEQDELFNQGRTVDGHIVSWSPPGRSLHNFGFAVDVVDRWRGYNVNWKRIAKIGEFCGLEQVDDPHFENRKGLVTDQFLAGMKPPPLTLPCAIMAERSTSTQPLTFKDLKNCGAPSF